jgi:tRNA dimethylallyltransferase
MVQSIILTGPTAVGKSSLAIALARKLNLEIVNADSVCFYRDFNIGSAKPNAKELAEIPHHLINIADPNETYHAGIFLKDMRNALTDIHACGKRAIIVGGSGFYLKALRFGLWEAPATSPELRQSFESRTLPDLFGELKTLDPVHAEKVGPMDRYRVMRGLEILKLSGNKPSDLEAQMSKDPNPEFPLWVVDRDPEELSKRMLERISEMLAAGFIDEVKALRKKYPNSKTLNAVGYAQIINDLDGILPDGRKLKPGLDGLISEIHLAHRQLAKSQRTWFKSMKPNESFQLDPDRTRLIEKLMNFYQ